MDVRSARPEEFTEVVTLLALLDRPDLADPERAERFREPYCQYLARADTAVLVAEVEGRLVGVLTLELRQRFTHTRPQAAITNIVVDPDRRGAGVGRALISAAEDEARRHGVARMTGESPATRTEAHAMLRRVGWRDHGIVLERWLE